MEQWYVRIFTIFYLFWKNSYLIVSLFVYLKKMFLHYQFWAYLILPNQPLEFFFVKAKVSYLLFYKLKGQFIVKKGKKKLLLLYKCHYTPNNVKNIIIFIFIHLFTQRLHMTTFKYLTQNVQGPLFLEYKSKMKLGDQLI